MEDLKDIEITSTQENTVVENNKNDSPVQNHSEKFVNQKPCWFYMNYNQCKYGKDCRFAHPKHFTPKYNNRNYNNYGSNPRHYNYYDNNSYSQSMRDNNSYSQSRRDNNSYSHMRKDNNSYSHSRRENNVYSQPKRDNDTYSQPKRDYNAYSQSKRDNNAYSQSRRDDNAYSQSRRDDNAYSQSRRDDNAYSQSRRDTNSSYSHSSRDFSKNYHQVSQNSHGVTSSNDANASKLKSSVTQNNVNSEKRKYSRIFTNSNWHNKQTPSEPQQESASGPKKEHALQSNCSTFAVNSRGPLEYTNLSKEQLQKLREIEISQLKKRFPNHEITRKDGNDVVTFAFSSSDPDWAFDLKSVDLEVALSFDYPMKVCDVTVQNNDEIMPPLLQKFLNRKIKEWIDNQYESLHSEGKIEIVLRPFLRWLDRNLEDLFIDGLKKVKRDIEAINAGIEFIPFESLQGVSTDTIKIEDSESGDFSDNGSENYENGAVKDSVSEGNEDSEDVLPEIEKLDITKSSEASNDDCLSKDDSTVNQSIGSKSGIRKGTEVKLLNFELQEDAASIQCKKIALTIRCSRCKTSNDVSSLSKQNNYASSCSKCHQSQCIVFNPMLMHSFSNILGYLHLDGCQVIDLVLMQCVFIIDCLNCQKQNVVDGLNYGQTLNTWCLYCNRKLSVLAQSVKFLQLQPAERTAKFTGVAQDSSRKKSREQVIEVGKPLPNDGTCKHYKRSHRWLRFPCCGKTYPCDLCHDEKELDHEMKFASRMLCGFCSKEQPFSKDKPCSHCSTFLTKKSGAHWEGGRGCRDKSKMNRDDKHKYVGIAKTTSRKTTAIVAPKKKV